jgi:hypothetical protein
MADVYRTVVEHGVWCRYMGHRADGAAPGAALALARDGVEPLSIHQDGVSFGVREGDLQVLEDDRWVPLRLWGSQGRRGFRGRVYLLPRRGVASRFMVGVLAPDGQLVIERRVVTSGVWEAAKALRDRCAQRWAAERGVRGERDA